MYHRSFLLYLFALATPCFHQVHGFAFDVSPPTQCGTQKFTWVDGQPPFNALVFVSGGTLRNYSIPADAYDTQSAQGSFQFPLDLPERKSVMFAMSDATGVTAGGITDVLTVGSASAGSPRCNTTDPGVDFFFSNDLKLFQCKNFPFSTFPNATQPITVLVTVAHGESFYLTPPPGDPFNWKANLTTGTSVMFTVTDAQNRVGGTSPLNIVGDSDDSSCLHPLPSSAAPTRTPSSPTSTSSSTATQTHSDGEESDTGIIIGASIAGAVALAIIIALVWFISKRSRKHRPKPIDLTGGDPDSSVGLLAQPHTPYPMNSFSSSHNSTITPYSASFPAHVPIEATLLDNGGAENTLTAAGVGALGAQGRQARMSTKQREAMQQDTRLGYYDPYNPTYQQSQSGASSSSAYQTTFNSAPSGSSSASGQKLAVEQQAPRRLVVHTDMEDEPIELPPMYSERPYNR